VATGWVRAALGLGEMLALNNIIIVLVSPARQNIFWSKSKKRANSFTVKNLCFLDKGE